MATWVGTLARGGVLEAEGDAAAGEAIAAYVVGEKALEELHRFFGSASFDEATRERRAAVEVCIAMAHADREVQPEERELLHEIVADSGLPAEVLAELTAMVREPTSLEGLEDRLTQPVLRELMLALCWELAMADERIDPAETTFFDRLARQLSVAPERARELRDAIADRLD